MVVKRVCRVVGHKRSKSAAWRFSETWRSKCVICGTTLERVAPNAWVPAEQLPQRDLFQPVLDRQAPHAAFSKPDMVV